MARPNSSRSGGSCSGIVRETALERKRRWRWGGQVPSDSQSLENMEADDRPMEVLSERVPRASVSFVLRVHLCFLV